MNAIGMVVEVSHVSVLHYRDTVSGSPNPTTTPAPPGSRPKPMRYVSGSALIGFVFVRSQLDRGACLCHSRVTAIRRCF